jgi:isoleucyl-tRNA synthetase
LDLESGFGIVVALDKNITEDLLLEGYARDIVRLIQEARKQADYHVADRIQLALESNNSDLLNKVLASFKDYIQKETLSTLVDKIDNSDVALKEKIDNNFDVKISLKK